MVDANSKRRGSRILRAAVILGIATLMMVVFAWTLRPKWRTFTFPADPKTGLAVAIDYPDTLEIKSDGGKMAFDETMDLVLTPHPPGDLVRWWQMHVLRQDEHSGEGITIFVQSGNSYQSMATIEKFVADVAKTPRTTLHITHTHHALGPAMEAWGALGDLGSGNAGDPLTQAHGAAIWPQKTAGAGKVSILMLALAPVPLYGKVGPAVAAMILRVHLVRRR